MAKTICLLNFKGGVGKTTTAINLGAALAKKGKKVLIIDLDAPGTTSRLFMKANPLDAQDETICDFLTGKTNKTFAYSTNTEGLEFCPSSGEIDAVADELNRKREREHILQRFTSHPSIADQYDYIILDCGPMKNVVTDNAMCAADYILIPVKCEEFSMYSLGTIMLEIDDVREYSNKDLKVLGIVATDFNRRTILNRQIYQQLSDKYPGLPFTTTIRHSVSLQEFGSMSENIFDYDPSSVGAADYKAFADEVLQRLEQNTNQ